MHLKQMFKYYITRKVQLLTLEEKQKLLQVHPNYSVVEKDPQQNFSFAIIDPNATLYYCLEDHTYTGSEFLKIIYQPINTEERIFLTGCTDELVDKLLPYIETTKGYVEIRGDTVTGLTITTNDLPMDFLVDLLDLSSLRYLLLPVNKGRGKYPVQVLPGTKIGSIHPTLEQFVCKKTELEAANSKFLRLGYRIAKVMDCDDYYVVHNIIFDTDSKHATQGLFSIANITVNTRESNSDRHLPLDEIAHLFHKANEDTEVHIALDGCVEYIHNVNVCTHTSKKIGQHFYLSKADFSKYSLYADVKEKYIIPEDAEIITCWSIPNADKRIIAKKYCTKTHEARLSEIQSQFGNHLPIKPTRYTDEQLRDMINTYTSSDWSILDGSENRGVDYMFATRYIAIKPKNKLSTYIQDNFGIVFNYALSWLDCFKELGIRHKVLPDSSIFIYTPDITLEKLFLYPQETLKHLPYLTNIFKAALNMPHNETKMALLHHKL